MSRLRRRVAEQVVRAAAARMRRRHPDWAEALLSEHIHTHGRPDQLGWAFGSLRACWSLEEAGHSAALIVAVAAMALYQWSADESLATFAVMGALTLMLGCVSPSRYVVSGVVLGAVVAGVNGFETMSGIRPAYESYAHSWSHDARWLGLVPPALVASFVGRRIGVLLPEHI